MTLALYRDGAHLRVTVSSWRGQGRRVALVPTMGALHAGHVSLIEAARARADRIVVSVFVNPTQFAPGEDFGGYPRTLDTDVTMADAAGADAIYAPDVSTMYPHGFATNVSVAGPAIVGLEDRFRPTHFAGVATIVTKLLQQVQPDVAFFGEKDFQQLRVVTRLACDLDIPVAIVGVPTHREADGLALSSRNVYLTDEERRRAPVLHRTLSACAQALQRGAAFEPSLDEGRRMLTESGFKVDYFEARRADTLTAAAEPGRDGRLLAAAWLGRTRLIDNVAVAYPARAGLDVAR